MMNSIGLVSLVVREYDEAIEFFTGKLNFALIEDTPLTPSGKRWVVVCPNNGQGAQLLLARAADESQRRAIGHQTGGRVFLFLHSDNFQRDYDLFRQRGVRFVRSPVVETWGTVAVFEDLYGNLWDLIQPSS